MYYFGADPNSADPNSADKIKNVSGEREEDKERGRAERADQQRLTPAMDKSDFLFLVNQQRQLQRKHPRGLRNWKSTLTLVRPPPFGTQTNAQVRRFNRSLLKAQGGSMGKTKRGGQRRRSSAATISTKGSAATVGSELRSSASTPGLLSADDGDTVAVSRPSSHTSGAARTDNDRLIADFSPIAAYQEHIDSTSKADLEHLEHPFYDPVGRRSAPAFSLSGRPRDPIPPEDEIPEYVLERGGPTERTQDDESGSLTCTNRSSGWRPTTQRFRSADASPSRSPQRTEGRPLGVRTLTGEAPNPMVPWQGTRLGFVTTI